MVGHIKARGLGGEGLYKGVPAFYTRLRLVKEKVKAGNKHKDEWRRAIGSARVGTLLSILSPRHFATHLSTALSPGGRDSGKKRWSLSDAYRWNIGCLASFGQRAVSGDQ